jgi:P-type conjugative transfer protein TrbJ
MKWLKPGQATMIAALLGALAASARAQCIIGCTGAPSVITAPGSVTSDAPVEQATGDIDTVQLPAILQALTTGGDAGIWQSNEEFLDSLGALIKQQTGLSYSDPQLIELFEQLYPGYSTQQPPPVPQDSVQTNLNTLNGTLQDARAQSWNWPSEQDSLTDLEADNAGAGGPLQATQTGNEIALLSVQQQQMIRQLIMALLNSYNVNSATQQQTAAASQLTAMAVMGAPPQIVGPVPMGAAQPPPD